MNPLDHAVQTTPIGKIAGPFEAPGEGWFLIKVLERRPREQAPFEQEEPQLRQMLAQRKQRTAAARAFRTLRAQYDIKTRDEGVSALYQQLNTPPLIQDFGDTAALIDALDLVISVDTAPAHLAGALGKRCFCLLPSEGLDFRWLLERSDSPWYPTMTLFRRPLGATWDVVIPQVASALARTVEGTGRP